MAQRNFSSCKRPFYSFIFPIGLHIWYICLDLVDFHGECRQIWQLWWILWDWGNFWAIFATSKNQNWPAGIDRSWVVCCNGILENIFQISTEIEQVANLFWEKSSANCQRTLGGFGSSKWVFLICVQNLWKQVCMSVYGRVSIWKKYPFKSKYL